MLNPTHCVALPQGINVLPKAASSRFPHRDVPETLDTGLPLTIFLHQRLRRASHLRAPLPPPRIEVLLARQTDVEPAIDFSGEMVSEVQSKSGLLTAQI
jgi:hypothetical protein